MLKRLKDYDFTLMFTPLLLTAFGTVMIYSASMVTAVFEGHSSTYYLMKQLQWFGIGFIVFIFCSMFKYKNYQYYIKPIMIGAIVLLVGLFEFGIVVNHAKSWYDFKIFRFQPSEIAKLAIIMYLSSAYAKKQRYIDDFLKGVIPPLTLTCIVIGLIFVQPDVGTSALILMIASMIVICSGIKFRHLFVLMMTGLIVLAFMIPRVATQERVARFIGAYKPFSDPLNDGFHLVQSYLAIGTGGLTGEGLGQSIEKLGYLPEAHTDFIMAIIAEELGFVGVVVVIGMLAIIVLRGFFVARKCQDNFGKFLAIGIASMIGIQTFVNLGAISGILPITGVPLPFVSYGGSSLLVLMASVGILNNIAKSVKRNENFIPTSNQQRTDNVETWFTKRRGRNNG